LIVTYFAGLASALDPTGEIWVKYLTQAPLAACLVWFMIRLERILKEHTKSINNLVRSQMVTVMTFHGSTNAAQSQAKGIIKDLEEDA
jgi:hypothetical protein